MKDTPTPKHTAEELIESIRVNAPNLYHIAATGNINGSLHADLKAKIQPLLEQVAALTAEVENLKGWLWQYREELKSTNVYHVNQGLINAINKMLPDAPLE